MPALACKANAAAVVERLRTLFERRAPDRIFAVFHETASPTQRQFAATHPAGLCEYPDPAERIRFWDQRLRERSPNGEDDSLPFVYLTEMDQGLYGAVLGGQIQFDCNPQTGWISSMVPCLLQDLSELSQLRFDPAHPWFQRYLTQLNLFVEGSQGNFGICPFVLIDSLNFIYELIGATATYLAVMDQPDTVRQAIELGFQVNTAIHDAFFERVPLFHGGSFHLACQWMPGRTVMESVDPFHLASVEYFEEWGRPSVERIFARYDGGEIHIHANGRHLVEAVASVNGLKAINLPDDAGWPTSFSLVRELRARAGTVPLLVGVSFEEFVTHFDRHQLPGGILYHVHDAPDVNTINRTMEKVRAYRCG